MLEPFELLHESDGPRYEIPDELSRIYGPLGFGTKALYANFVTSLDGVATLGSTPSAGSVLSGRYPADRFVMGLLRACADAVLLGAGTLRATPNHLWTAGHVCPDYAPSFVALRKLLGRRPDPRLVVVTASGNLDVDHRAIVAGATVVTTARGAHALRSRLPASCDLVVVGDGDDVDLTQVMRQMRERGHDVVLTEGGPHLVGELVDRNLLEEVFLTISPVLAGRDVEPRLGMIAGTELLPGRGVWTRLAGARRHGDYLFLRYGLRG